MFYIQPICVFAMNSTDSGPMNHQIKLITFFALVFVNFWVMSLIFLDWDKPTNGLHCR